MKSAISRYRVIGVVAVGMMIGHGQSAWAGWTGSMNGTGYGKASVNVTSSTIKTNIVSTPTTSLPSASITNATGYKYGGPLPSGASRLTFAGIKGQAGYVWKNTTTASNGDKTDNSELQYYVTPTSPLATTELDVLSATVDTSETNGCGPGQALYTFIWHWSGSDAGTAQQVKFYEFDGELPTNSDFWANADVGSLDGAEPLTDPIFGLVYNCDVDPCPTNFDEVVTYSFCATNDPNLVYMVTDGIAVSLPCPLSFTGFLPPIGGADATGGSCTAPVRAFKQCSTIPVKMNLLDCKGLPVTTGNQMISVIKCGNQVCAAAAIDATPKDRAATGNLFTLKNAATGLWQFNLSLRNWGMGRGTWQINATLSDGSVHSVYISVK
ncbi:MAG TPA: hypothetical protein VLZ12_06435 [Verrucomicrobiae bacterium]|nr:hypothetical protein [Verrucomicrobiae bacterium]